MLREKQHFGISGALESSALVSAAPLLFTSTVVATGSHFKQGSKARMRDKGLVIVSAAGLWAKNCQDLILSPAPLRALGLMEHVRAKVCLAGPSLGSFQTACRLSLMGTVEQ